MRERVEQADGRDEIDGAEEIGDDLLAVGLAAVTARSTVAPHGGAVDHVPRQGGGG